jgi:alpha-mannosidase
MENTKIYLRRIKKFHDHVYSLRYSDPEPLVGSYIYDGKNPIPFENVETAKFRPIAPGKSWGKLWGSAWFRFKGAVPDRYSGKEVVALIDTGSEACVFKDGTPWMGLTRKRIGRDEIHIKRRIPLHEAATGGEPVDLLIEAGANGLFGANEPDTEFILRQAELACFDKRIWQFALDVDFLIQIIEALPERSPRRNKLLYGLNQVVNEWREGFGFDTCNRIIRSLYKSKAADSSMTAWSVGHAHLDLGWLWPVRETRRKGGRTFATALRMIEEYPEYKFGASQPQLYAWIKEDYPDLYSQVKQAVVDGTWECQGAMWVEPDMNITGGEALVRQCLYGKRFYQEEFGIDVDHLWLPDVFGYSAALPQILKKSGVDIFMTQKISWNETNTFPHHTFYWQGIDGTRILTHFLPANNYNVNNRVGQLVDAEARFAQSYVQDDFLNLYGTGDGGGGPSRLHIEYGLRAGDVEGVPKFKFAFASDFFKKIAKTNPSTLPVWAGELYLELHRGTYTTQGKMKRLNRKLELALRNTEFLAALAALTDSQTETLDTQWIDRSKTTGRPYAYPKDRLDTVWKDTLLNQFHDILPGSSIGWVYSDAHRLSEKNLGVLSEILSEALEGIHGPKPESKARSKGTRGSRSEIQHGTERHHFIVYNTLSWDRHTHLELPLSDNPLSGTDIDSEWVLRDGEGRLLPMIRNGSMLETQAILPSMGYTVLSLEPFSETNDTAGTTSETKYASVKQTKRTLVLENEWIRVTISAIDGTIDSIFDKRHDRESLAGAANRLMLWEDIPYSWDAWDISSYYRQTTPSQAVLQDQRVEIDSSLHVAVRQRLTVGNSEIRQTIHLYHNSPQIVLRNTVDWHEDNKMLRVQAETCISSPEATYEIQYGTVRRPTHENTSWDAAKFEVAGHRFADLSQVDYGFAVLNDCKYGHYIRDNIVDLTLLRSPKKPDPDADMGTHEFVFAYLPHQGGFTDSDVLEQAHELNSPPIVRPITTPPAKSYLSYFSVFEDGNAGAGGIGEQPDGELSSVKIEVVKAPEDGDGMIVRLYEAVGRTARIRLSSGLEWNSVTEVDLLERPMRKPFKKGLDTVLKFSPYEIRTFRLE